MKHSLFNNKQIILFYLFIHIFFSACQTKQEKFLNNGSCCQRYVEDRGMFLDSLFTELFPEKFNSDSIISIHTIDSCHTCYKRSPDENNFKHHPNNLNDTLFIRLTWSSSNIIDDYESKYLSKFSKRPDKELIPRFKVFIYYNPNSICNTLTERWEFYSGKQYVDVLGDWADKMYADEFIVFDYVVKENILISEYSNSDFLGGVFYEFGIENDEDRNKENIKRAKSYGSLKFDTLMNWKSNYLNKVTLNCTK